MNFTVGLPVDYSKLDPRNSMYCEVCTKYYNGTYMTERITDFIHPNKWGDCVHGNDLEITRELFFKHARQTRGRL